jgi:glycosyltransferase involved in cell wall biosynthesis
MKKFKILIPVYNDWQSLSKLLNNIDSEIQNINHEISIIVVDDASTFDRQLEIENLSNINSIKILIMRENRGHARCIAAGLKYIFEKEEFDYVIPMDGDGEDRPEEIKNLLSLLKIILNKLLLVKELKDQKLLFLSFVIFFIKL